MWISHGIWRSRLRWSNLNKKPGSDRDKILLVLDLDETLVYAREQPLDRPADFVVYGYHVYRRPHLDTFLQSCMEHFEVGVWSSASDAYVEDVVREIFPDQSALHFVWGRSRASFRRIITDGGYFSDPWNHQHYTKPLAKLKRFGWRLERILIVDDTPEKCRQNYGNAIYPREYDGSVEDNELILLARYLETLSSEPNVRTIEKRTWREKFRNTG
jgi:carboxy-terminal domain RNA polymerase II polypeptide A small phosphatase